MILILVHKTTYILLQNSHINRKITNKVIINTDFYFIILYQT